MLCCWCLFLEVQCLIGHCLYEMYFCVYGAERSHVSFSGQSSIQSAALCADWSSRKPSTDPGAVLSLLDGPKVRMNQYVAYSSRGISLGF